MLRSIGETVWELMEWFGLLVAGAEPRSMPHDAELSHGSESQPTAGRRSGPPSGPRRFDPPQAA